jgi:hypothetical protein
MVELAPYLFCTRPGECYAKADGTANSWESMWGRFVDRLLAETKVEERFTEHDLRANCASDAGSLEHARARRCANDRAGLLAQVGARQAALLTHTSRVIHSSNETAPVFLTL